MRLSSTLKLDSIKLACIQVLFRLPRKKPSSKRGRGGLHRQTLLPIEFRDSGFIKTNAKNSQSHWSS